jgi:hypothetical protein
MKEKLPDEIPVGEFFYLPRKSLSWYALNSSGDITLRRRMKPTK